MQQQSLEGRFPIWSGKAIVACSDRDTVTMAHSVSPDIFSKLPPEIRLTIFKHFFQSFVFTERTHRDRNPPAPRPAHQNSINNILLVSKQWYTEAKECFLKHATLHLPFGEYLPFLRIPSRMFLTIQHFTMTIAKFCYGCERGHPTWCSTNLYQILFDKKSLPFLRPRIFKKANSITYEGYFNATDDPWQTTRQTNKHVQTCIKEATKYARDVRFQIMPRRSKSPASVCTVSIKDATKMTVKGIFMLDVREVALNVCRLINSKDPMTCRLEKTFAIPGTELVEFGRDGKVIDGGSAVS